MSLDLQRITIPLSYFYYKQASSPTVVSLSSTGVPTGWSPIGATIGEGTFEYSRQLGSLELEGYTSAISGGTYYSGETASITIPIAEASYNHMIMIMQPTVYSGNSISFGGLTATHELEVLLVTEHRAGIGIFHYFQLYRAILESSLSLQFSKSSPVIYEVTFRAVLDLQLSRGNQLGKIYISPVNDES